MALNPSSGWSYYKQITISDTANVSADYQLKLTVYSGAGADDPSSAIIYCNNHCKDFPNDIRFGTDVLPLLATQLPQWIESTTASSATIWIKCPSDGSDTFYMFVGNSNANQYSSGEDTFIFFDDFDTLDTDIWEEYDPDDAGSISAENSCLHINIADPGNTVGAETKNAVASADGSLLVAKVKGEKLVNDYNQPWVMTAYINSSYSFTNRYRDAEDNYIYRDRIDGNTSSHTYSTESYTSLEWRIIYIKLLQDSRKAGAFTDYYGGTRIGNEVEDTRTGVTDNYEIHLKARSFEHYLDSYCDWVFVAKYSSTEPSWSSFGSWKSLADNDLMVYYDLDSGVKCIDCRCSRWDVSDYSVIVETWLNKSQLYTLLDNITPGAVGELYKVLGRPVYYDATWQGKNTLRLVPNPYSDSNLKEMRDETIIYVKNITTHPVSPDWIEVKIEGYVSGSGAL